MFKKLLLASMLFATGLSAFAAVTRPDPSGPDDDGYLYPSYKGSSNVRYLSAVNYTAPGTSSSTAIYTGTSFSAGPFDDATNHYSGPKSVTPLELKRGDTFTLNFVISGQSAENSDGAAHVQAEIFADWDGNKEFSGSFTGIPTSQSSTTTDIAGSDEYIRFIGRYRGACSDVLNITQEFTIPESAPFGRLHIRVKYCNSWHDNDFTDNVYGPTVGIFDGMTVDIPVDVVTDEQAQVTIIQPAVNGSFIVKDGATIINNGDNVTIGTTLAVEAKPDSGYELDKVIVNDVEQTSTSFTVQGATTVTVTFKEEVIEYCTFPHATTSENNGGRYLSSITMTNQTTSDKTLTISGIETQGAHDIYHDFTTTQVIEAYAGDVIKPSVNHSTSGNWIHCYMYIDYDRDGAFSDGVTDQSNVYYPFQFSNNKPIDGSEIVSFPFYSPDESGNGYNSLGASLTNNPKFSDLPAFTLPTTLAPGDYRIRFNITWNELDPCGTLWAPADGDATATNNRMDKVGGSMTDFTLRILAPTRQVTIESVDNGTITATAGNTTYQAGTHEIAQGTVLTITATPNNNSYALGTLTVTGATANNDGTYTVGTESVNITATFVPNTYAVTVTADNELSYTISKGGTELSEADLLAVEANSQLKLEVTVLDSNTRAVVTWDGARIAPETDGSYLFTVTDNGTLVITTEEIPTYNLEIVDNGVEYILMNAAKDEVSNEGVLEGTELAIFITKTPAGKAVGSVTYGNETLTTTNGVTYPFTVNSTGPLTINTVDYCIPSTATQTYNRGYIETLSLNDDNADWHGFSLNLHPADTHSVYLDYTGISEDAGNNGGDTYSSLPANAGSTVYANFTWNNNGMLENGRLYVDWNKDGDFTDTTPNNELVYQSGIALNNLNPTAFSFTVPTDLVSGQYRARFKVGESSDPCVLTSDDFGYYGGITVDFLITLSGDNTDLPTAVEEVENTIELYYANGAIHTNAEGEIQVYDLSGKLVRRAQYAPVAVDDLANGIYIVRVNGNTLKFVK